MYILVVETSSVSNMMGKKVNVNDYLKFWLVSGDRECTLNPVLDIRERNTITAKVEKCLALYKMTSLAYLMI